MMTEIREILHNFISLQFGIIPPHKILLFLEVTTVSMVFRKNQNRVPASCRLKISPSLPSLPPSFAFPANYNKGGIP